MKILITGSTGFLGNHFYNLSSSIFSLNRFSGNYKYDLSISEPVFNTNFDLVIHAAGKAHCIPKTNAEKHQFYKINVVGTQNLLNGLEKAGIPKKFVFISSVAVYGKESGTSISENEKLNTKEPYGLSKIQAEKLVTNWCNKNKVVCTILRLPLLVGENPPGNLGAMIIAIKKRYYFNIGGGGAKKSMVLAGDVAKAILKVAEIGGIYNLTDGYHPSFAELSKHISIQLGKGKPMNMPMWFAKIVAKLGDLIGTNAPLNSNKLKKITTDLTFDDTKARESFGWNPDSVLESFKIENFN